VKLEELASRHRLKEKRWKSWVASGQQKCWFNNQVKENLGTKHGNLISTVFWLFRRSKHNDSRWLVFYLTEIIHQLAFVESGASVKWLNQLNLPY